MKSVSIPPPPDKPESTTFSVPPVADIPEVNIVIIIIIYAIL